MLKADARNANRLGAAGLTVKARWVTLVIITYGAVCLSSANYSFPTGCPLLEFAGERDRGILGVSITSFALRKLDRQRLLKNANGTREGGKL